MIELTTGEVGRVRINGGCLRTLVRVKYWFADLISFLNHVMKVLDKVLRDEVATECPGSIEVSKRERNDEQKRQKYEHEERWCGFESNRMDWRERGGYSSRRKSPEENHGVRHFVEHHA
jgi:hypothetical protein